MGARQAQNAVDLELMQRIAAQDERAVEEMYDRWRANPATVDESWRALFEGRDDDARTHFRAVLEQDSPIRRTPWSGKRCNSIVIHHENRTDPHTRDSARSE